jgi:hypothetical protein
LIATATVSRAGGGPHYDSIVQASIFAAAWAIGTLTRHRRAALATAT